MPITMFGIRCAVTSQNKHCFYRVVVTWPSGICRPRGLHKSHWMPDAGTVRFRVVLIKSLVRLPHWMKRGGTLSMWGWSTERKIARITLRPSTSTAVRSSRGGRVEAVGQTRCFIPVWGFPGLLYAENQSWLQIPDLFVLFLQLLM